MAFTWPMDNDIVIPAGRVTFAPEVSESVAGRAEIYLGDSPSFSVSGSAETVVVQSSDDVIAVDLVNIPKSVSRSASLTCRNASNFNWSLFFMGDDELITQSTGSGNTTITGVELDRYYRLATGVQGVTVAATGVKIGTASGTVLPATTGSTTNYELDTDRGVIYFPTGSSATGNIYVAYAKAAKSWRKAASAAEPVYGTLRFYSNNTVGDNFTLTISRCSLVPNGEANMKGRDNPTELAFTVGLMLRGTTPMIVRETIPA